MTKRGVIFLGGCNVYDHHHTNDSMREGPACHVGSVTAGPYSAEVFEIWQGVQIYLTSASELQHTPTYSFVFVIVFYVLFVV